MAGKLAVISRTMMTAKTGAPKTEATSGFHALVSWVAYTQGEGEWSEAFTMAPMPEKANKASGAVGSCSNCADWAHRLPSSAPGKHGVHSRSRTRVQV